MDPVKASTSDMYRERILRVLVHIQSHLDEDLAIDDLARIAHFSPFHFHRIFRGMVGETVMQHVRRLRLERAAGHLKQSNDTITAIAQRAGYRAHASFTRAFHDAFGCSPTAYRDATTAARTHTNAPYRVHSQDWCDAHGFPMRHDIEDEETTAMHVTIKTRTPTRVAFIRWTGPYHEVGPTWEALMDWAGSNGHFNGDTRYFGASYDDPDVTPAEKIRYDACITIGDDVEGEGDVGIRTIPGGTYAVTIHEGPYEKLGDTYTRLMGQWFPASGYEPGDAPCLEFYLNEPDATPQEDLLTEIWVLLRTD